MKNLVRQMRTELGWSQAHLGDELGVSRQTINAIENGRYDPSLPLAFKIADTFETSIEDVFLPDTRTAISGERIDSR